MRISLRQLEVFDAVAQTGSVSGAAQKLGLSQPATSLSLGDLEAQLNRPLFQRRGKRLGINETGQRLRGMANAILRQLDEFAALAIGESIHGTLRLSATPTIADYVAPGLCAHFMRQHPGARIQLVSCAPSAVMDRLENMECDLGLIESACNRHTLRVTPWLRDDLIFLVAPHHPLAGKRTCPAKLLGAYTWYLPPPDHSTRISAITPMGEYASSLDIAFVADSIEAIKRAVREGDGIGCLSRLAVREEIDEGTLVEIKVPELAPIRRFSIIWRRDSYQSELERAFVEFVVGDRRNDNIRRGGPRSESRHAANETGSGRKR